MAVLPLGSSSGPSAVCDGLDLRRRALALSALIGGRSELVEVLRQAGAQQLRRELYARASADAARAVRSAGSGLASLWVADNLDDGDDAADVSSVARRGVRVAERRRRDAGERADLVAEVVRLRRSGLSQRLIAERVGLSRSAVAHMLAGVPAQELPAYAIGADGKRRPMRRSPAAGTHAVGR